MAINLDDRYPGRANGKTLDYPQGSFKNRTSPTSKDGTYLEQDWANDQLAFFQSLMKDAGLTANGSVDTVQASQYFDALVLAIGNRFPRLATFAQIDALTSDQGPVICTDQDGTLYAWDPGKSKYVPQVSDLQWLGTPIGKEFSLHPNAPLPPTNDPRFRYVILTAGLDGTGQYNEGVLTDETVTGSDPTITATATVSLAGSPMNGQTIDLINTSRVFLRPGPTAGAIVNSQNLAHTHIVNALGPNGSGASYGSSVPVGAWYPVTALSSGGDEARPRYIPRVYLMRIL